MLIMVAHYTRRARIGSGKGEEEYDEQQEDGEESEENEGEEGQEGKGKGACAEVRPTGRRTTRKHVHDNRWAPRVPPWVPRVPPWVPRVPLPISMCMTTIGNLGYLPGYHGCLLGSLGYPSL